MKLTEEERFWAKVEITDRCWLWTAGCSRGYARFRYEGGQHVYAHRYAWELLVGEIPEGMTIDHLCRVSHCVNPEHMRVVTHRENVLAEHSQSPSAINFRKTHCIRGHSLSGDNLYLRPGAEGWQCRACWKARRRERQKV